ncbi:hypothetical protein Tco_1335670 [Tanacetum coccineum]
MPDHCRMYLPDRRFYKRRFLKIFRSSASMFWGGNFQTAFAEQVVADQGVDQDNDIDDSTPEEVKRKVHEALNSLSLHDEQCAIVQFWAPTRAGKAFLLTTTYQPIGIYRMDRGLDVYHKGCLQHKLYVDPEKDASFGLVGLVFKEKKRQQTENMNFYYPENQRPVFESNEIFPMKWGSFAVPVYLNNDCVGVLEFVTTKSMSSYDDDMDLVEEALKCAGFQTSAEINTPKTKKCKCYHRIDVPVETASSIIKRRKTQKREYGFYNRVALFFGLTKEEAMERVTRTFNLPKKVKETTFTTVLRKLGITEWPCVAKKGTEASTSSPENPTASDISAGMEPTENAHLIHDTDERQPGRDFDAMENQNDVQYMAPIYTEDQVMPDHAGTLAIETLDIPEFAKTLLNPTSSGIPTGLDPAENAHLIHDNDTNGRQRGIDSDVPENRYDDIQLRGLNDTDDQIMSDRVRAETAYFNSSYDTLNVTWYINAMVQELSKSHDSFQAPDIHDPGELNDDSNDDEFFSKMINFDDLSKD